MQQKLNTIFLGAILISTSTLFAQEEKEYGNFSLLTDFVYMQRYQHGSNTIVVDSSSGSRSMTTKSLANNFEPGLYGSLSYIQNAHSSYEAAVLFFWGVEDSSTRQGNGTLSFPFRNASFASDFFGADKITARLQNFFYTLETNYWHTFSSSRYSYFVLSGMFGLRFANLDEKFTIDSYKNHGHSSYEMKVTNDLIGLQIGLDFQIRPFNSFYWDLLLKFGADLNRIQGNVFLGDLDNTITLRNNTRQKAQTGVFAQAAVGAGYQPFDWLNIHAGYQMYFFGGLALGTDQTDTKSTVTGNSATVTRYKISANGYLLIHGIYTGLTFSF